jgi:hypothetical protein
VGLRGQGKTEALRAYSATREPRRLALDPYGDFEGGYEIHKDWREGLRRLYEEPRSLSVRLVPPVGVRSREWAEPIFEALAQVDPERFQWDLLLIMDEITKYSSDREGDMLQELVLQGRRLGIRMALGCQYMVAVPKAMMRECTDLLAFKMRAPTDRERLAEWTQPEAYSAVRHLPKFRCLVFSPL